MFQRLLSILRSFLILLLILDNESPDILVSGKHLGIDAAYNVLARGKDYLLDAFIRQFSFTVISALSILNLLIRILRGSLRTMHGVLFLCTL